MLKNTIILLLFYFSISNLYSQKQEYIDIINQINKDSLYSYIAELSGERQVLVDGKMVTLNRVNHQGNEDVAKYLRKRLVEFGYDAEILEYENVPNFTNEQNVVCKLPGTSNPDVNVIFCAHYDALNIDHKLPVPGADDNATGCAVVMEVARILKDNPQKNSIIFAFFDSEETGSPGSFYYVTDAVDKNMNIAGVVNVDMIGYNNDSANVLTVFALSDQENNKFWEKAQDLNNLYSLNINLSRIVAQTENGNIRFVGDITPFWLRGFKGLQFTEDVFKINPYYHTENDKIEHLDFEYLLNNGKLATLVMLETANKDSTTSVDNISKSPANNWYFTPNPAEDYIEVNQTSKGSEIRIYNVMGECVLTEPIHPMSLSHRIYVSHLPVGVYSIRIGEQMSMFVKQ